MHIWFISVLAHFLACDLSLLCCSIHHVIELSSLAILNTYLGFLQYLSNDMQFFPWGKAFVEGINLYQHSKKSEDPRVYQYMQGTVYPDEPGVTLLLCIPLYERKHFCLASTLPPPFLGPWTFEPGQWGSAPGDSLIHQCVHTVSYVHRPQKRHCLTIRLGAQPQLRPTLTKQFLPCIK